MVVIDILRNNSYVSLYKIIDYSRREWWTVAKILFEFCIIRLGLYFVLKFYQKFSQLPVISGSLFTKYTNGMLQAITEVPTSK